MKKVYFILIAFVTVLAVSFTISACNKKFDEPSPTTDPTDITANTTIKTLKAMHTTGGYEQITTDIIISGIVVGDDKSGNLYKQICVQDATAGITLLLDASNLFAQFPVGRRIFIKCKGLWLSDYGKLIQIGAIDKSVPNNPSLTGIPSSLFDNYIVKGSLNNAISPKVVTINQLNDSLASTLIQINNVEFIPSDTSRNYADTSANKSSVSLTLQECSTAKVVTYTSGYATFAGLKPPKGNGTITCIYYIYKTTPELIIRDTSDVQLKGPRCSANASLKTIAELKAMYTGTNVTLGNFYTKGIVISDANNKNLAAGNIVIQDGTSGIDLYYGSSANTAAFNIGDSIVANVTGGTLTSYNGMIEISLAAAALPGAAIATGKTVTPNILTIAQLNTQMAAVENTLVKIVGATATPAGTYSGNKTLTDASSNLTLYTATAATFASQTLPTVSSDWVGIPSRYNATNQFQIRNLNDVTSSASGGGGGGSTGSGIPLTTSPVTLNFDGIGSGLPQGVTLYTTSSSTALGTAGSLATAKGSWSATGAGFKNYASATGLTATSDQTAQDAATNRALGMRQTGTTGTGGDPGTAFVFQFDNTTGKTNFKLDFLLQSLDNTVGRSVVWNIDYGFGDTPTTFTTATTSPATISTTPTFGSTAVSVNFGNGLDNKASKVWVRIVTLAASTGSGSRPSTAIDDVKFTWQ
jgi:hypothetical protein